MKKISASRTDLVAGIAAAAVLTVGALSLLFAEVCRPNPCTEGICPAYIESCQQVFSPISHPLPYVLFAAAIVVAAYSIKRKRS